VAAGPRLLFGAAEHPFREALCGAFPLTNCAVHLDFVHRPSDAPATFERHAIMTHSFEDADAIGKEFLESGLRSFAAVSKGVQAIALDATEYTKKSYEEGSTALQKLAAAKSAEAAFEIQSGYARSAYESLVSESTKMIELYAELARDAYKPFEQMGTWRK
jgi:phasin family protein